MEGVEGGGTDDAEAEQEDVAVRVGQQAKRLELVLEYRPLSPSLRLSMTEVNV